MKVCSKCKIDIVVPISGRVDFGSVSESLEFDGELCDVCIKELVRDFIFLLEKYNLSISTEVRRKSGFSMFDLHRFMFGDND